MTPRAFRMIQCFVSWLFSCGWVAITVAASLCLLAGNFIIAWQSFALQGFENTPLAEVPFLSSWAVALGVGAAPMSALYALLLTVVTNVTAVVSMKLIFELETLMFDWRRLRRSQDPVMAGQASEILVTAQHLAGKAAVITLIAILVLSWDVALFRFRYEALLSGLIDPNEAIAWLPDPVARLGSALANLVGRAAWGYAACILAAGFATENAFERARERWVRIGRAIDEAVNAPADAPAPDAAVAPITVTREEAADRRDGVTQVPDTNQISDLRPAGPMPTEPAAPASNHTAEPVAPPSPRSVADVPVGDPIREERIDVIVGAGQTEAFTRREVESDSERFVRDGAGRHWFRRDFYEEHIVGGSPVEEEAAHA